MLYFNFQPKVSRRTSADYYSHHRSCISNWKYLTIGCCEKIKMLRHSQYVYKCSIALSDIVWGTVLCFYLFDTMFHEFGLEYTYKSVNYKLPSTTRDLYNTITYTFEIDYLGLTSNYKASYYSFILSKLLCYVLKTLFVSLTTLVFAAGDRYFAIAFPFKYRSTYTVKLAKIITVILWVLSTVGVLFTEERAEFTNDKRMALLQAKTWYHQPSNDSFNHKLIAVTLFALFGIL